MPLLKSVPEIPTKSVRDIIYDHIRQAINHGDLKADTYFTDVEIAQELGVSRTPVREAVQRLESDGYIERVPMKGNKVKGHSAQDLALSFSIRTALEVLALKYAAINVTESELAGMAALLAEADTVFAEYQGNERFEKFLPIVKDFNNLVFGACKSDRLLELVWQQRETLDRYLVMRNILPHRMEKSLARRKALYEALRDHDPERAGAVWKEHLDESYIIWKEHSGLADQLEGFRVF